MAEETAEKIVFSELLEQFGSAKDHFANSQREVLLGMREICRILVELTDSSRLNLGGEFPVYLVKATGAVIDYLLARVPERGAPAEILAAKIQAIDELIVILDEEIGRFDAQSQDETEVAKIEAVAAIKKYLQSEKESAIRQADDPDALARIRKVVIE